jgi:CheY-like chemotaxis protein
MPCNGEKVLIVDDELSIRTSMSIMLAEIGYLVRSAEDGFSALREIRLEMPEILLSDLNMPGMSGFELLSVVRRRFPAIQTIAMSGAFSGDEVPSGVAADAFYQKGSSMGSLLRIIEALHPQDRIPSNHSAASPLAPIWIEPNQHNTTGETWVTIACPECLRTFPQSLGGSINTMRETDCIHCRSLIHYAIVQPMGYAPANALQRTRVEEKQRSAGLPEFNY